jgi:hypothetical protein
MYGSRARSNLSRGTVSTANIAELRVPPEMPPRILKPVVELSMDALGPATLLRVSLEMKTEISEGMESMPPPGMMMAPDLVAE